MNQKQNSIETLPPLPVEEGGDGFAAKDILIEQLLHRIDFLEAEVQKIDAEKRQPIAASRKDA